ncbi:MAG: cytochrome C [Methylovirgula sp.]|nr:cytochrome C [Methylovirgula sp.]
MKRIVTKLALLTIVSCVAGPLLASETVPVKNCTWCHGPSGQGYSNAPRLAGQQELYLDAQLMNFRTHVRDNPYSRDFMWNAVVHVDEDMAHGFASYFASLPPEAANDGNRDLVASGRNIFEFGVPEANIAACIVCHGPNGEGVRGIPRLGGLSYFYLKRRLEEWAEGYSPAAEPMPKVARSLSGRDIEALASYLSFLEYGAER